MNMCTRPFKRQFSAATLTISSGRSRSTLFDWRSLACIVILFSVTNIAQASLITYQFGGEVTLQAIDNFPVAAGDPYFGILQYDTNAPVIDETSTDKTYFDASGFMFVSFGDVTLVGAGLEISITRINLGTIVNENTIGFQSDNVFVAGSTEPLDYMSLSFGGTAGTVPDFNIPAILNDSLVARFGVVSPDFQPSTGGEPPRSGFLFAQGTQFSPVNNVAEPGTYLLIALGLLGLYWSRFVTTTTLPLTNLRPTRDKAAQ